MNTETHARMLPIFIHETEECLFEMDEAILALSRSRTDDQARRTLARAAHTVAGNAAAMGYHAMLPDSQCIELTTSSMGINGVSDNALAILIESRNKLRRFLAAMPRPELTPMAAGA